MIIESFSRSDIERFLSKIIIQEGCWGWKLSVRKSRFKDTGYGSFKAQKKTHAANRIAFELFNGELLPGLEICHSCDNPVCVNPEHLFQDTHRVNIKDALDKGRSVMPEHAGEKNGMAKLLKEQVLEIYHCKANQYVIASHYGIRQSLVSRIKNGTRWASVTGHGL